MVPQLKVLSYDLDELVGRTLEEATITPLADTHIGSAFNDTLFLGYREWILARDNAFVVITGDVLEMATKNSVGNVYDTIRPREQKDLAIKFLEPLAKAGRILAYLDGNHEHRIAKESDTYIGEYICGMMGIPQVYDPDGIFLFLRCGYDTGKFSEKYKHKGRNVYTVFMLHGWTGSRTIGGKANNLEGMSKSVVADLYLSSHTHQQLAFPGVMMVPDSRSKKLVPRKQMFTSTGSFLEWAGYSIRGGYKPALLGTPRIILDGKGHDVRVLI